MSDVPLFKYICLMINTLILFLFLTFSAQASTLVLIGGGERPLAALSHFVRNKLPGPIYVLPWGTEDPVTSFETIKAELLKVGADQVECFCDTGWDPSKLKKIKQAGGIYFPGGDQNLIMERLKEYNLIHVIKNLFTNNVPVAGTSAGCAIQSSPMLTGVESETARGLGLLSGFIVDQHFLVRNRQARLLEALKRHPHLYGLGVDENMSIIVTNLNHFKAIGPSLVTFYVDQQIFTLSDQRVLVFQ